MSVAKVELEIENLHPLYPSLGCWCWDYKLSRFFCLPTIRFLNKSLLVFRIVPVEEGVLYPIRCGLSSSCFVGVGDRILLSSLAWNLAKIGLTWLEFTI